MADGLTLSELRMAMPMCMIVRMLIPVRVRVRLAPCEQKLLALYYLSGALGGALKG
jgi:hypothetical protein